MKDTAHDSPTTPAPEPLLAEFPLPEPGAWRAAAEALLKGAPFEKKLLTRTPEGIEWRPIYGPEDIAGLAATAEFPGAGTRVRGGHARGNTSGGWLISQELPLPTAEEFNTALLHDLERGQTEINLPLDVATIEGIDPDRARPGEVGACGVSIATLEDMERAFAGVHLPMVSVYLRAGASALPAAALFLALARKRGVPPQELRGCIETDPLGTLAWKGSLPLSLERAYQEMALLTLFAVENAPGLQTVAVSGTYYADAGASAVQELGCALATGVEYVRELARRGIPAREAAPHVRLCLGAGSNLFMETAKFRAARQVWSQAVRALGADASSDSIHLHGRTATFNKTVLDPYSNLLRTATEAFSAVVGGCDSLHVGPFDEVFRLPDEFSRRLARNTQVILAEECDLNHVIDPAGGSYFVEWLTDQVARRAWAVFQEIEKAGGMARALAAGLPQTQIADVARARADAVAKRRTVIVGTNLYPGAREPRDPARTPDYVAIQKKRAAQIAAFRTNAAAEDDAGVLDSLATLLEAQPRTALEAAIIAVSRGATLGEISQTIRAADTPDAPITPLRIHRAAQPFERLREAAAAFAQRTGIPPAVFQANIGPSRLYRLRADWTTGFFEVGGFKVAADRDFTDIAEAAAAALASGARIVVITSSDETYAASVEPLARALKASDAALLVLVAGAARESEAAWRAAGVDECVNVTSNTLELLTRLLTHVGAFA